MIIKTATIIENGIASDYHLARINGVATWCYESGKIITDANRLAFIANNA